MITNPDDIRLKNSVNFSGSQYQHRKFGMDQNSALNITGTQSQQLGMTTPPYMMKGFQ